jgi:hypothetical protein
MSYGNADTTPKVGFRPYHQTNPFSASHLSGVPVDPALGAYFMERPFDPWELYSTTGAGLHGIGSHDKTSALLGEPTELGELLGDLGQNHPFKTTAWHLHGLGDAYSTALAQINASQNVMSDPSGEYVTDLNTGNLIDTQTGVITLPDGTVLTPSAPAAPAIPPTQPASTGVAGVPAGTRLLYTATRAPGFVWGAGDISSITAALKNNWGIIVDQSSTGTGTTPTVSMYVHPIVDYGLATDIQANIDHEIINSGRKVQNSSISIVGAPPQVAAQTQQSLLAALAQAQASGDTVTAQAILKTLSSMGVSPSGAGTTSTVAWIENNAMWIGLGLAGLIVLGPLSQGLFGKRR